ncbi:MAG: FctA domain-containing protein [Collinsella sp.]
MKANSDKSKQSNKAMHRVLAGVLCGASVLSLVLSLVMPPISQAIANDAQTGAAEEAVADEGSLGDGAGADNNADKDAKEQNSDDAEHGEGEGLDAADPSADGAEAKGAAQPSGDEADDGDGIAPVAEDETKYDIHSGEELASKLQDESLRNENGATTFKLVADIEYNDEVGLVQNNEHPVVNIILDLNGHKLKHSSNSKSLFDVANGATLTIKDSVQTEEKVSNGQQLNDQGQKLTPANYGEEAILSYDNDGIPTYLSYYVTESSPEGTGTTESLVEHGVDIKGKGAIVACDGSRGLKLININDGGHFSLESGVLTQQEGCEVRNLVYAGSGSTVNMKGGYVCGGYCPDCAAGAGISVENSTLSISNGVIAGNRAPSGGGVYANGSAVTVTGGVISGNSTLDGMNGFGGGIMAEGGSVAVSGGYITNNCYANFCGTDGNGDHGGAGLAANNGAHVTISGGQITGNYSEEAGGGVYVTDVGRQGWSRKDTAWLTITGGTIASNVSFRSEGAGIRVGQMVDAMVNGSSKDSPVYITNNHCMSRFDWGGGGVFVQGDSNTASNAGRLFVYNSYISANIAGGYGGGVAVCPTGKTLVTNTEGTAIFGNSSAGADYDYHDDYNAQDNTGNEGKPHLSEGGHDKNQDFTAYNKNPAIFRENGHADFFLAATGHSDPIAAVIGKMLGGGDAKFSGSIELEKKISIPANGGVQVKNSIGLSSGVNAGDDAATAAQGLATTFITGNYSWNHGGGIMSNGDLYLGQPADTYVYPSLKLKATKVLDGRGLKDGEFSFTVYRKDSNDPFTNGVFNRDACTEVGTANNDESGNIAFNLGEQFAASGTADKITYYLVEDAGEDSDITYDSAVYEIVVKAKDTQTSLMSVPKKDNPNEEKQLVIHNYTIENVSVTKREFDKSSGAWINVKQWGDVKQDGGYYCIGGVEGSTTFTNKYTPYTSTGSWTPEATKVVKGGEMKEFTLELADNPDFADAKTVKTRVDGDKSQTLSFLNASGEGIKYSLSDITKNPFTAGDPTGRGASKTFTYYVCEKNEGSIFSHYKFDQSVYKLDVTMTDQKDGTITATKVTYTQIKDADGNAIDEGKQTTVDYNDGSDTTKPKSIPTFTNTYSTSLPLSGMSGVTLTYLAGAAVLCAAAAWMHIRRKANAKGGERRE